MLETATTARASDRPPLLKTALARGLKKLRKRIAAALRPRRMMRPSKFIPRCMRLDRVVEATTRYKIGSRPWFLAILDAIADPEVRTISICAATQLGKTLLLIAILLWLAEHAPAPAMVVLPDREAAIEFRDRVYVNAAATIAAGKTERIKIPPEHQWNTRHIDLGSMRVYLAWSGSRQRLRGRPCKYVFDTEVDVYKGDKKAGDPIAASHQRTKAFFRYLHFHESSPSEYPSEITDLEGSASARYRWHVRCPHCGGWQELRFFPHSRGPHEGKGGIGGIKNAAGELHTVEEARNKAHYVCLQGCRIDAQDKQAMLESGQWLPFGCLVNEAGEIVGQQPTSRRSLGYKLWSIHSESISFADLAASYVEARENGKLAEWFGNWLGESYRPETKIPTWQELGKRAAWTHGRRTVPREAWFLTFGGDVQGENKGVRYVIRAWAPGVTSWLVDWGWLERVPGDETDLVKSDLALLGKLALDAKFPVVDEQGRPAANPLGRRELATRLGNVDSNHLPLKVHHWLRSLPEPWVYGEQPRVRAIRGDHQLASSKNKSDVRWRMSVLEANTRTGEKYEGGLVQWGVNVYPYYDDQRERLAGESGKLGSWHVTADCLQLGRSYLEQVTNFGQFQRIDEKTGEKKIEWGPRSGRIPVDFWDCEIYARIAADMVVGDLGWSEQAWRSWADARSQGTGVRGQESGRSAPLGTREEFDWDAR